MANLDQVKSKNVSITLMDGKERHIRFDLNAMAELEDKFGSVEEAFKVLQGGSIKALRFVLWAGLVHEDESLTERYIGKQIDIQYMETLMKSVNSAFDSDMPSKEDAVTAPNA